MNHKIYYALRMCIQIRILHGFWAILEKQTDIKTNLMNSFQFKILDIMKKH